MSRADTEYILDSFWVVRDRDVRAYGEYRTKKQILEVYDAMANAIETGEPYRTTLDPPPGDPRRTHGYKPAKVVALADRRPPAPAGKVVARLPFWPDLQVAAGPFEEAYDAGTSEEIEVWASRMYERKEGLFYFAARIDGPSMEPRFPDGTICVFRRSAGMAPSNGQWVLIERHEVGDAERAGRRVFKEYRASGRNGRPQLVSLNDKYEPLDIHEEDRLLGEWVEEVEPVEADASEQEDRSG